MKHNGLTFSLVDENFILYSMVGKHATVMGLFRTSSDCSYFLTFQNEQFHLDSKKEETLNSSSDDSLKYNNKERKAHVGRHHSKCLQSRLSYDVYQVTTLITSSVSSHICLARFCIFRNIVNINWVEMKPTKLKS